MVFSVGDVREVGRVEYGCKSLESVEEVFERLYAPTRVMARDHAEVHRPGKEDAYRFGSPNSGRLEDLEEEQETELEKDISVELLLEGDEEPVTYEVNQINDHEKRYMANAPSAVKLVSETGDSFVLHEAKEYQDAADAFHFGEGEDIQRFGAGAEKGYISIQEFFQGIQGVYGALESQEGFSPLLPEIGVVEETGGYDSRTEHQMYFMRDFDELMRARKNFPNIPELAELAASLDLLGISRADADPDELLHSDEGFIYESDLEKMQLVAGTPVGDDPTRPGMERMRDIFRRVHSAKDGSSLEIDGSRATSQDIINAIDSEYPEIDQNAMEIRRRFRKGIQDWDPEDLPEPFVDLRN